MKSTKSRIFSWLIAFAMVLTIMNGIKPSVNALPAGTTTVKIHYLRPDGNYQGWNLWVWDRANNGGGSVYQFTGKDEDGVFTAVDMPTTSAVGVIVRTDSWAKDTNDVIVDTSNGDVDLYITSTGNIDTTTSQAVQRPLTFTYDQVNVNIHYYRFDETYTNWDVWSWVPDSSAAGNGGISIGFTGDDSYGKVASHTYYNMNGMSRVGFIVRVNNWSDREQSTLNDGVRMINLAYADKHGNVDAYVLTRDAATYYSANLIVKARNIDIARMDTFHDIYFQTNLPVDSAEVVKLTDGTNQVPAQVTLAENRRSGQIKTVDPLDLNKQYKIEIPYFNGGYVTLGQVYSSDDFKNAFHFSGELGALYTKQKTNFRVWSPMATQVELRLYSKGIGDNLIKTVPMAKGDKGVWSAEQSGNLAGTFYTYNITVNGQTRETEDLYSKAVGVNGDRSMVIDLSKTNPAGWNKDKGPEVKNPTDAIIYEVDIRDVSMDPNSGIKMKGKYVGLTETGTKSPDGEATGIDHLKELGITHVHILPFFDFASIDETQLEQNRYSWGYDPKNYQVPEGSYSVDPYSGSLRVEEVKEMIKALHDAGIGVIMDSVYNHTYDWANSPFNRTVPDYYYRHNADGTLATTSGCQNDTDSEKSMFRKYMIDSVTFWAKEYHVDGFRFDLMGLHDIETMNDIRAELDKINPQILMYGEGWDMGNVLPQDREALKVNMNNGMSTRIAAFSDDMRDGIKGHVFTSNAGGFVDYNGVWQVNGRPYTMAELKELVKFGVVASTPNDGVDMSKIYYDNEAWAAEPTQTINYASCHDNNTLWDRIWMAQPQASIEDRIKMDEMAQFLVLTSQGIPFLHAGEEMLRSKPSSSFNAEDGITSSDFVSDSVTSPDSVNALKWADKSTYRSVVDYYEGLIKLRNQHPAFRMATTAEIQKNLKFLQSNDNTVAYTISNNANRDKWNTIAVIANAGREQTEVTLPSSDWTVVVNGEKAGTKALATISGNKVIVPPLTSMVLVDSASYHGPKPMTKNNKASVNSFALLGIAGLMGQNFYSRKKREDEEI